MQRFLSPLAWGALGAALFLPAPLNARPKPVPVIDLHVDLPYRSLFKNKPFSTGSGQFAARDLLPAGVRGVVLPLFVPTSARPRGRTREQLERAYAHVFGSILQTRPYSLPGCEVHRAGSDPRSVQTWLAFEGAGPVGADEVELRRWALRGVRSFGLVHSVRNRLSDSSGKGPARITKDSGLTDEGRRFVRAVARVGGVVDVSHASDAATDEAIRIALEQRVPIVATHSNARALAPHPRNLTDRQIRGIAQSGGVVGVNFHQPFLAGRAGARARLSDVVQQFRYIAQIGGSGAVAIGSDFEGGISVVPELSDATRFQVLVRALEDAGFSSAEIRGFMAGNAARVLCP